MSPSLDVTYFCLGDGGKFALSEGQRRLYVSIGDYSLDRINHLPSDNAPQNPLLPFGKIEYIDLRDGSLHPYSLGHRNPQGLVILKDGRMLESEHGPRGGDELNLIKRGKNYGWPYESFGTKYGQFGKYKDDLPKPNAKSFEEPMYAWVPSIAPTQLVQVTGFDKDWDSDLLLGSLAAQSVVHIKLSGDHVLYTEQISLKKRIRDMKQVGDSFYCLTDEGALLELRKAPPKR